jgi:murein DD-endopeptidase MepM/ murein hydrolase activator NlpD
MWQRAGKAQVRDFKQALTVLGASRRDMFGQLTGNEASARAALTRARASRATEAPGPESRKVFSLVVDLAAEPVGPRWARGAATLALLCGAALALAPGMSPFSTASARTVPAGQQFRMNAMLNVGADEQSAASADPAFDRMVAAEPVVASDSTAVRVQGAVTDGLYWSLRSAGVPPQIAADYLQALSTRIDVGADVAPYDRFDLVISKAPREGSQPLLYAALRRADSPDVELMKWSAGGRSDWFDTDAAARERSDGLMAPVAGRVTSSFGVRRHPILRFARFHAGIDFGAHSGSPIVAAADGMVVGAGWAGGYGRQVRVAHGGGIITTYSHMSGIAAGPGTPVRQGQVIGYVGSTGLSTGPHLHFEVRVNGRAVDPTQVRLQSQPVISGPERQAFNARLKQLMAIGKDSGLASSG